MSIDVDLHGEELTNIDTPDEVILIKEELSEDELAHLENVLCDGYYNEYLKNRKKDIKSVALYFLTEVLISNGGKIILNGLEKDFENFSQYTIKDTALTSQYDISDILTTAVKTILDDLSEMPKTPRES